MVLLLKMGLGQGQENLVFNASEGRFQDYINLMKALAERPGSTMQLSLNQLGTLEKSPDLKGITAHEMSTHLFPRESTISQRSI